MSLTLASSVRYDFDDGGRNIQKLALALTFFVSRRVHDHYARRLVRYIYISGEDSANLIQRYHTPAPSAGLVPTADSTLINGKGRYAGGPTSPLTVIRVLRNKRYRFRLVSISCDPNFVFSIDGHTMVSIISRKERGAIFIQCLSS